MAIKPCIWMGPPRSPCCQESRSSYPNGSFHKRTLIHLEQVTNVEAYRMDESTTVYDTIEAGTPFSLLQGLYKRTHKVRVRNPTVRIGHLTMLQQPRHLAQTTNAATMGLHSKYAFSNVARKHSPQECLPSSPTAPANWVSTL